MSRILMVDDDFDILKLCQTLLTKRGHEVLISTEAKKAFKILTSHTVDLLVVDIMMPDKNGFELIQELKKLEIFKSPILMLTARSASQDVLKALSLGATDYVCKPFDPDIFLKKIETILGTLAPAPEIHFAKALTHYSAEIKTSSMIRSISEMAIVLYCNQYLENGHKVTLTSTLFEEIGIACPPLRTVYCRALTYSLEYHYEVCLSFIGLHESSMQKIRKWIQIKNIQNNLSLENTIYDR